MSKKLSKAVAKKDVQAQVTEDRSTADLLRPVLNYRDDARFLDLHRKEGYLRGTIYDSRPYNWDGSVRYDLGFNSVQAPITSLYGQNTMPKVAQRKPNSPYHLGRIITNRFVALLFGEGRFPRIRVPKDPDTELYLNELVEQIQLQAKMTEAAILGGGCGSVVTAFKVVDGEFQVESFNSKFCRPVWKDFHRGLMQSFSFSYPFAEQVWNDEDDKYETKHYLSLRIVTEHVDATFIPMELVQGVEGNYRLKNPKAKPVVDEEKSFVHGLGFVPAVFIQNISRYDEVDGDTNCEGAYDLIDRINENLSAINSAIQGNLDPTLLLKVTPEDYRKLSQMGGIIQTGASGAALVVGDKGDGKYLEIECKGIEVALNIIDKLRTFALEMADCVIADPHKLSGAAQSAAAIAKLYGPMLAKCDALRTQYGKTGIVNLLYMMMQAYHLKTLPQNVDGVIVKGVFVPMTILDPSTKTVREVKPLVGLRLNDIKLQWGEYFGATTADVFQAAEAAAMATGQRPVTTVGTAVKFLAAFLGDPDPDRTIVELEEQAEQEKNHEMEMTKVGTAMKQPKVAPKKLKAKPAENS